MTLFRRILVPTDYGAAADRAVQLACELAKAHGATLTLLHVFEIPVGAQVGTAFNIGELVEPVIAEAKRELDAVLERVNEQFPGVKGRVSDGSPPEQILEAIGILDADLVVMGTHGRTGLARALVGSVAERVVRESPVPVLTVHAAGRSAAPADDRPGA